MIEAKAQAQGQVTGQGAAVRYRRHAGQYRPAAPRSVQPGAWAARPCVRSRALLRGAARLRQCVDRRAFSARRNRGTARSSSSERRRRLPHTRRRQIEPLPGLMALLDRADAAGIPMVAVTNAPRLNAELLLSGLGITHRFKALVIGDELPHGKPHPLPYQEGLRFVGAARRLRSRSRIPAPACSRRRPPAFRLSASGRASAMPTLLAPARSPPPARSTIRSCSRVSPPRWHGERLCPLTVIAERIDRTCEPPHHGPFLI